MSMPRNNPIISQNCCGAFAVVPYVIARFQPILHSPHGSALYLRKLNFFVLDQGAAEAISLFGPHAIHSSLMGFFSQAKSSFYPHADAQHKIKTISPF